MAFDMVGSASLNLSSFTNPYNGAFASPADGFQKYERLVSPFDGRVVQTLDNIVTVVGPEGFAMQTPDARSDAEADTSNGICVFTGGPPGVAVGDQVDVTGQVAEFFEHTEFTGSPIVSVCQTWARPMEMETASARNSTDQSLTISRSRLRL